MGYTRNELQGISWYHLLHWESMREAQSKHRLSECHFIALTVKTIKKNLRTESIAVHFYGVLNRFYDDGFENITNFHA